MSLNLGQGIELHRAGRLDEARRVYQAILAHDPHHADCLNLLGILAAQTGKLDQALASTAEATRLRPDNAEYLYNHGNVLKQLGRFAEAVAAYDRALDLQPTHAKALANRGLALFELHDVGGAVESYRRAIACRPDLAEAHYNLGNALQETGALEAAVESYDRALAVNPQLAAAHYNRATALRELGRPEAALAGFEAAWRLQPATEFLAGMRMLARTQLCDWEGFEENVRDLEARVARGERAAHPFALLSLTGSAALQRTAAEAFVRARYPRRPVLGPIEPRPPGERIRIGYFSPDFRNHPVAYLSAELFEAHDRRRFEVFGFSFGPRSDDEMRRRVSGAFDRFVDVADKSDLEAARLARELGIDIAIDLAGHTKNARTGIFALRAAPIQASYLGYLGTTGADYMDYLLADAVLVPPVMRRHYSESIASLPWYQANDTRRVAADRDPTREEFGLPAGAPVFCCFNNSYKILPGVFDSWMRILRRVPDGLLLLYASGATVASNLRKEAQARGVDPARIVFTGTLPIPEYLARFRVADLFLDTSPYNAGTVAADSLWAGLPLLTLVGETFAGRMGASLLTAAGAPELIARTPREYEDRAVELATDPSALAAVRQKIRRLGKHAALFDIKAFTAHLEAAYTAMYQRERQGLPPQDLEIR